MKTRLRVLPILLFIPFSHCLIFFTAYIFSSLENFHFLKNTASCGRTKMWVKDERGQCECKSTIKRWLVNKGSENSGGLHKSPEPKKNCFFGVSNTLIVLHPPKPFSLPDIACALLFTLFLWGRKSSFLFFFYFCVYCCVFHSENLIVIKINSIFTTIIKQK